LVRQTRDREVTGSTLTCWLLNMALTNPLLHMCLRRHQAVQCGTCQMVAMLCSQVKLRFTYIAPYLHMWCL